MSKLLELCGARSHTRGETSGPPGQRVAIIIVRETSSVYFSPLFYRGAALCSLGSAITTLGLIFLPRLYQPVPDFEARMALIQNSAYVLRSWV